MWTAIYIIGALFILGKNLATGPGDNHPQKGLSVLVVLMLDALLWPIVLPIHLGIAVGKALRDAA